jgi:hypothetical protein
VKKYLQSYADNLITTTHIKYHDYVLVIPAYQESNYFVANLIAILEANKNILIIIIINHPEQSCDRKNQELLVKLQALGYSYYINNKINLISYKSNTLALCGSYDLPKKEGVGRARKIGADWALRLIDAGKISCPVIFSTDADATIPANYFACAEQNVAPDVAAFVYPFEHKLSHNILQNQAIRLYEQRLHNYVLGLSYANSPYAFHTIGSTIAINALSYAQVRGFPCRPAGEDFYVLNKLRKVGIVKTLVCDPIVLSSRISHRVPFGTGPAVGTLVQKNSINNNLKHEAVFYHPHIFTLLKNYIYETRHAIINNNYIHIHPKLIKTLRTRTSSDDKLRAFDHWFDGFMTLKFVHNARDQGLAMCSLSELEKIASPYRLWFHE